MVYASKPAASADGHAPSIGGDGVHFITNAKPLYMRANLALILEKHKF